MSKTFGDKFWDEIESHRDKNKIDDPFGIGKVVSVDPLIIELDGLPLYKDNLYINKHLLPWREYCTGLTTVAGSPPHSHGLVYINHPSKLILESHVVLYGIDYNEDGKTYQKYVVLEVVE